MRSSATRTRARRSLRISRRRRRERSVDLTRYRSIISEWDAFLSAAARPEPTVFRVRTGRVSEAELTERLQAKGFRLRPVGGVPGLLQVEEGPVPVSMTLEHWLGLLYVQQASTGAAALQMGVAPGERVLDLCAAPGGKTTHLAELMHDRGCLVASEIDERRIRGLLGNVYRLGHPNVLVVSGDGRMFPEGARFDRVLVDAPCSGEGTLRRRAGEAPNQSRSFLGYVTRAQRALLERAIELTRPGGTILYVTCTFAPEENEAVVSDVLARAPVELEALDPSFPHARGITRFDGERFDECLTGAVRVYPHHLDSGGLFIAKLRRLGGGVAADAAGAGWSAVPQAFPGDDLTEAEADERVGSALAWLAERHGAEPAQDPGWGWTVRGGRAWLQTAGEWPMEAWAEGAWRPIAVGIRSFEFDSRDRPRPTNDFLRLFMDGSRPGVLDVDRGALRSLLGRAAVSADTDVRGPVAVGFEGDVLGRGAVTARGLVSEIPKARARELERILEEGSEG